MPSMKDPPSQHSSAPEIKLNISERITECNDAMKELLSQISDYNHLVMLINALKAVEIEKKTIENDEHSVARYQYSSAEYEEVLEKVYEFCSKHEFPEIISAGNAIQWESVKIV